MASSKKWSTRKALETGRHPRSCSHSTTWASRCSCPLAKTRGTTSLSTTASSSERCNARLGAFAKGGSRLAVHTFIIEIPSCRGVRTQAKSMHSLSIAPTRTGSTSCRSMILQSSVKGHFGSKLRETIRGGLYGSHLTTRLRVNLRRIQPAQANKNLLGQALGAASTAT